MMRTVTILLLAITVYLGVLVLGLYLVCIFQRDAHSDLSRVADRAAWQYLSFGKITDMGDCNNLCVFFCAKGENDFECLYSDVNYAIYEKPLACCIARYKSYFALFRIQFVLYPLNFFAIASSPVYAGEELTGSIYVIRAIRFLPNIVKTLIVFHSLTFLIALMHVCFARRTNDRIMGIYRKYIANVSHELKSPITSIKAITSTLSTGLVEDEETRSYYYRIIDRESQRLEQSVLDIIELSKIQDKRIDAAKKIVSMSDIITPIHERYSEFCEETGIRFIIDPSVKELPELYTNAERIVQLLQILLDNAVKFTAEDGEIMVSASLNRKSAILHIRDTGCGMSEEIMPHIFERFYRGVTAAEYAGSGLGLAIAKEIVNILDEKIWAESQPGIGSCFSFTVSRKKKWYSRLLGGF